MSRPPLRWLGRALVVALLAGCAATGSTGRASGSVWSRQSAEEKARLAAARQDALERNPSGVASLWQGPNGRSWGEVVPLRTTRRADGIFRRDYRETLISAGREVSRTREACRSAGGRWERVPSGA